MDQLGFIMFDFSKIVDWSDAERDQERDNQHGQDEHQIIEDKIDISSVSKHFTLGAHIS